MNGDGHPASAPGPATEPGDIDDLLDQQSEHYRALGSDYLAGTLDAPGADELEHAVDGLVLDGDILELACGPGVWTPTLLRHARTVTALDASPEMLALARKQLGPSAGRTRFLQADLFTWRPDQRYDHVFFGFWLSHVPPERFTAFWALVDNALAPDGTVTFVDDAHRGDDELVDGPDATAVQRRLPDGRTHRIVKVAHTADSLTRDLADLGWDIPVHATTGPFYWGHGRRAGQ